MTHLRDDELRVWIGAETITVTANHTPSDIEWQAMCLAYGLSDIGFEDSDESFDLHLDEADGSLHSIFQFVGTVAKEDRHLLPVA